MEVDYLFINGEWLVTQNKINIHNPATGEKVFEVTQGNGDDVQEAILAANQAFQTWSKTAALERANYLMAISQRMQEQKEHLAQVITTEMGKPIHDARGEVQSAIDYFRWFSEEARRVYGETIPASTPDKKVVVVKQPIGVVGAITPWNFPLSMIARKVAPALAAGCTIVLKPSSKAPQSAIEMTKIFEEVSLPKGIFNLVIAPSSEVTDVLMESKIVRKITFTGSTRIGKLLLEKSAKTVKRISLELGGHAPFIVFEDANIEKAAQDVVATKFRCSGQMCTSTNRIFVHEHIKEEFTELLIKEIHKLKVGNGLKEETNVGPVIDKSAERKIQIQIEDAVAKGAEAITATTQLTEKEKKNGTFIQPTVLKNVLPHMRIFTEETFGPVAPIIPFSSEEELLKIVNHEDYGLAAYMYSNNMSRIIRMSESLEYGMIGINDPLPFVVQSPFGGVKESGVGKEGGHQGIDEYLEEKMISISYDV